jgi:hypothetical protein
LNGNAQQEIMMKMNGLSDSKEDKKPEMSERDKLKEEIKAVTSKDQHHQRRNHNYIRNGN